MCCTRTRVDQIRYLCGMERLWVPCSSSSRDLFPGLPKPVYRTSAPVSDYWDYTSGTSLPITHGVFHPHLSSCGRSRTRFTAIVRLYPRFLTLWLTTSVFLVPFTPRICAFIDTQVTASPRTLSISGLSPSLQRPFSKASKHQAAWH